jgi:hypothetical protein
LLMVLYVPWFRAFRFVCERKHPLVRFDHRDPLVESLNLVRRSVAELFCEEAFVDLQRLSGTPPAAA